MENNAHISVMPKEVLGLLGLQPGATVVDGTLGMGGHAALMAEAIGQSGHLIGIDRDPLSLAEAKKRLSPVPLKVDLLQGNFSDVDRLLAGIKVDAIDAMLLDLGISSFQLDDVTRGFAFKDDGPLDMRMDQSSGQSAADLVNRLPESELAKIIEDWGEDRFARRIAKAIVHRRSEEKIKTTGQLADVVLRSLPKGYTRGRIHPATRTFQALRIAVNGELASLSSALDKCLKVLKPGGRLCVIAFHSLEDRIVKTTFRRWAEDGLVTALTKKPLQPTDEECEQNSRSRSAKVRAIEKT
jgi:16S rRNA (cytosine1402-N4)-methyltransferase